MALTKKHFIAIAREISSERDNALSIIAEGPVTEAEQRGRLAALENMAHSMCALFRAENPAFDQERFLKACGF